MKEVANGRGHEPHQPEARQADKDAGGGCRTDFFLRKVGFCTSAEASPIRTKYKANSTTRFAIAMRPNAVGSSRRETVAVYTRLAITSATVEIEDQLSPDAA
jgi:hypothetical protein